MSVRSDKLKSIVMEFDIILTHDKGIVPSSIRMFMKKQGKRMKQKLALRRIYNHSEIAVVDLKDNVLKLHTAVKEGVVFRKNNSEVYDNPKKKLCILRYAHPENIKAEGVKNARKKAYELLGENYDLSSLLFFHVINALTGWWWGRKGGKNEETIFCYEDDQTIFNKYVGHKLIFDSPQEATFWDFNKAYADEKLKIIFQD